MNSFEINGIFGAIIQDTRRAKTVEKKIIKYPVKYRITYNRKQIYFKAGYDLTENEWNRLTKTKEKNLVDIRKVLNKELGILKKHINSIIQDSEYTHERLKTLLKYGKNQKIYDAFQRKIDELNNNGQVGTASIYTNAQRFINEFHPNVKFSDINLKWLSNFERYAFNKEIVPFNKKGTKLIKKVGLNSTTLAIYLRCLRSIFNTAISNGLIKGVYYPFVRNDSETNKFRIKEGSGTKIALTVEQIKAINSYLPPTKSIEFSRDLFMLMFYLGGINFKDLLLLTWDNIKKDELVYVREKTKGTSKERDKKIIIPLTRESNTIIEKYSRNDRTGYLLPLMEKNPKPTDIRRIVQNRIRQVNKHLSKIGKELKINGLSTYVARHSFATILKNSGVPISFISESLGHTSVKTTENYLKSFEKEQRAKTFEILSNL